MSDEQQNTSSNRSRGYADTVKSSIIEALENGTSVLQKERQGIDYPVNASSGTVYSGVNFFYLQQERSDKKHNSPFYMTVQQAQDKGLSVKSGEKGSIISYYAQTVRFHRDEYARDDSGKIKKDANGNDIILHKKNEPKLNEKGQPYSGNEYNYVFNIEQINTAYRQYRQNATLDKEGNSRPGFVFASKAFVVNPTPDLQNPFPEICKKGAHYMKTDDNIIERLTEDFSKYVNSCTTGEKFKAVSYTPNEIKELREIIMDARSPFFQKVNDGYLAATGQTQKLDKINENRQKKTEEKTKAHAM
jgi:hypothetical protein